jgi:hypothetical protein
VLDVLELEWPVKGNSVTSTRSDMTENGKTDFIPFKFPRQYGRKCDDEKTIGKVGNAGEARLQTALECAVTGSVRITKLQSATSALPENHNDNKAGDGYRCCQPVGVLHVSKKERNFGCTAAVIDLGT